MCKKTGLISFFILLFIFVFSVPGNSTITKVGKTGMQLLKIDVSARGAAMGGAYTMNGYDATGMFYNPATVAQMNNSFDFFANKTNYVADINYSALGLAFKLPWSLGKFGINAVSADYGNVEHTEVANNDQGYVELGTLKPSAYAVGISYARRLTDRFSFGANIKYAKQELGWNHEVDPFENDTTENNNTVNGMVMDFGTIYYPGVKSLRFGISIRNFSSEWDYGEYSEEPQEGSFELPLNFIMGAAFDFMDLTNLENHSMTVEVNYLHPRDYSERIHVGAEYWFNNMIALRGGYKFNYDEESLSLGAGLSFKGIKVDYAYSMLNVFEGISRFSLGYSF